jgi:hypothetical protein
MNSLAIGSSEVTHVLSREAAAAESETGQSKRNVPEKQDASRVINDPIQYWVRLSFSSITTL